MNTTHFIVTENKVKEFKENKNVTQLKKKYYAVNVRWLFHCYFFFKKVDERDKDYRVV